MALQNVPAHDRLLVAATEDEPKTLTAQSDDLVIGVDGLDRVTIIGNDGRRRPGGVVRRASDELRLPPTWSSRLRAGHSTVIEQDMYVSTLDGRASQVDVA